MSGHVWTRLASTLLGLSDVGAASELALTSIFALDRTVLDALAVRTETKGDHERVQTCRLV